MVVVGRRRYPFRVGPSTHPYSRLPQSPSIALTLALVALQVCHWEVVQPALDHLREVVHPTLSLRPQPSTWEIHVRLLLHTAEVVVLHRLWTVGTAANLPDASGDYPQIRFCWQLELTLDAAMSAVRRSQVGSPEHAIVRTTYAPHVHRMCTACAPHVHVHRMCTACARHAHCTSHVHCLVCALCPCPLPCALQVCILEHCIRDGGPSESREALVSVISPLFRHPTTRFVRFRSIWSRPLGRLPVWKDVPRLMRGMRITEIGEDGTEIELYVNDPAEPAAGEMQRMIPALARHLDGDVAAERLTEALRRFLPTEGSSQDTAASLQHLSNPEPDPNPKP